MRDQLDMVGLGEPLVVMVPDRAGPLRSVSNFARGLGGAECNVLSGMSRLGLRCGLISRVGDDEFGAFVTSTLRASGIDTSAVEVDCDAPTGVYFRGVNPLGHSSSPLYYRAGSAASRLRPESVAADRLASSAALVTTGITALLSETAYNCVREALATARARGCKTVFDPNLRAGLWGSHRAAELLPPLLSNVDVYLGGVDETRLLLASDDSPDELATAITQLGPSEAVIRKGAEGAIALTPEGWVDQPAYPVLVRDPVGAGDAFNAGYLACRERKATTAEAVRAGTICASAVCATLGDFEAFPLLDELETYLSENGDADAALAALVAEGRNERGGDSDGR